MGGQRLTNKIIDQRLKDDKRSIKRIGVCKGYNSPIEWQCLIEDCGCIWNKTPDSVLCGGTNCPDCYKLTDKKIDKRLGERPVKRLGNVINAITDIKWQCLIEKCNHIWEATPHMILNKGSGCPECWKLNDQKIDERLIGRSLKRIGRFINSSTKIEWECLIDGHKWNALTQHIFVSKNGCPECEKISDQKIDNLLLGRNIKRLDNCQNVKNKAQWQCLIEDCNRIWEAPIQNVLYAKTGCPDCKINKNAKSIHILLKNNNINPETEFHIKNINNIDRNLKFDFYLKNFQLAIEYNGEQHYNPVQFGGIDIKAAEQKLEYQKERDIVKRQFCKDNNIELIEIDGRTYKNKKLEKYVLEELIPYIQSKYKKEE